MDFMNIVLTGYNDQNSRKHLSKYFMREYKKAEKQEYYEVEEFFDGCKGVLKRFEANIEFQKRNRHQELQLMLTRAVDGLDEFESKEAREGSIERYELEIAALDTPGWFSTQLHHVTKGEYSGDLSRKAITFILEELESAYSEITRHTENNIKHPASYYALYHWILIEMGREKPFELNKDGQFIRSQIQAFASERYQGISSQQFYRAFISLNIKDRASIAINYGNGYKEKLITISDNDANVIAHLKSFPR